MKKNIVVVIISMLLSGCYPAIGFELGLWLVIVAVFVLLLVAELIIKWLRNK